MTEGTVWEVTRLVRLVDGDSIRAIRSRLVNLDGRRYRLSDADPLGILLRLTWVDTPEKGDPQWAHARDDLTLWCENIAVHPLRVICFESAGWDRILCDLIDVNSNSASQWMMKERQWPAYQEK